jgi:hypothetical protein
VREREIERVRSRVRGDDSERETARREGHAPQHRRRPSTAPLSNRTRRSCTHTGEQELLCVTDIHSRRRRSTPYSIAASASSLWNTRAYCLRTASLRSSLLALAVTTHGDDLYNRVQQTCMSHVSHTSATRPQTRQRQSRPRQGASRPTHDATTAASRHRGQTRPSHRHRGTSTGFVSSIVKTTGPLYPHSTLKSHADTHTNTEDTRTAPRGPHDTHSSLSMLPTRPWRCHHAVA